MLSIFPQYSYLIRLLFLSMAITSIPFDLTAVICAGLENHESKRTYPASSPEAIAVSNSVIIASGAFVRASFRLFPARVLPSDAFTGPMIFVSLAEAKRLLFTGINVFPSLQLNVSIRKPFLKCMSVWSKTLEPSSVFLQLVRLKRLSSIMNTFFRFSSVRTLISLLTTSAARREVKRSQFVFAEFKIYKKYFLRILL